MNIEIINKLEENVLVTLKERAISTEEKAIIIKDYKDRNSLTYKQLEEITGMPRQTLRRIVDYKKARQIDLIRKAGCPNFNEGKISDNIEKAYKLFRTYNIQLRNRSLKFDSHIIKKLEKLKDKINEFYDHIKIGD